MNLLQTTRHLCSLYDINPQKKHGQNFLISDKVYSTIIEASGLSKSDLVLEVGPGLGFLTAKLAEKVERVVAIEIDDSIFKMLKIATDALDNSNIELIHANVLDFREAIFTGNYKVVANLPYNITSVFLRKFLSSDKPPTALTLMLQKEVVNRILAVPGSHSLLSLSVQFYSSPELVAFVGKENFWPQPKVDSAILQIELKDKKDLIIAKEEEKLFFRLLKFGFSAKRKKLKNNLAGSLKLQVEDISKVFKSVAIKDSVRAQELSLEEWFKLFAQLRSYML
jgi:16S rRNA (adenine1518-N6/adenine1519-N6)-dimethyltransferase